MAFYTRGKPDKLTYVCLLPCTPLLQPETLNNAITAYERFHAATDEMMVSVCEYPHPVGRAMWIDPDGLFMDNPTWATSNTQECNTLYHDAGQFYIATAKRWRSGEPILSDGAKPFLLDRFEAVDIDTPEDWRMAELIYKGMEAER
jgi:N-acylneuraminate cytidylyltransferase